MESHYLQSIGSVKKSASAMTLAYSRWRKDRTWTPRGAANNATCSCDFEPREGVSSIILALITLTNQAGTLRRKRRPFGPLGASVERKLIGELHLKTPLHFI
jgi:hypothetical protein